MHPIKCQIQQFWTQILFGHSEKLIEQFPASLLVLGLVLLLVGELLLGALQPLVEEVDEADGVARARLELLPVLAEDDAEGDVVHARRLLPDPRLLGAREQALKNRRTSETLYYNLDMFYCPCGRGAVVERTPLMTKVVSSILAQSEEDFVGGRELVPLNGS